MEGPRSDGKEGLGGRGQDLHLQRLPHELSEGVGLVEDSLQCFRARPRLREHRFRLRGFRAVRTILFLGILLHLWTAIVLVGTRYIFGVA